MKPLISTRTISCQSARDPIWVALADTHRLNRAIGHHPLQSEPIWKGAERYLVKTRLAGLNLEYEEEPFQWSQPEFISITRKFRNGPACRYRMEWQLAEQGDGSTLVTQQLEIEPRSVWVWLFVLANLWLISRRLVRETKRADANIARGAEAYTDPVQSPVDRLAMARAQESLAEELNPGEKEVAERLAGLITSAPDVAVSRLRPFELADQWGLDRRQVVSTCLQGVIAGMLDLSWDIICPSCRTVTSRLTSLSDLEEQVHCHLCDITVRVDFDRAVEATFRPAAGVRTVQDQSYCIGGPFRTPHVVAQAVLPAHGTARLQVPDQEGRYRLFVRGGATVSVEVVPGAATLVEVAAGETATPAEASLAPGGSLQVRDRLGEQRHVKLEHLAWASAATTGHYISTFGSFRRLFSSEVMRPGLNVNVARVALLFTDLTGSTAMYTRYGDAKAYCYVQEHFSVLEKAIERHGGAVVKTIGDAVMAAFPDERSAVVAAIELQRAYCEFARQRDEGEGIELCVGVFAGASYLVNANNILDYFGQTVNIANRLQGCSQGGQIIVPAELAECGERLGWLTGAKIVGQFEAELKGLSEPLAAVRLAVDI